MDNQHSRHVIGKKQILRLAKENALCRIQIATDADKDYVASITSAAEAYKIPVENKGTMAELAAQFGIEVPCGAVGFQKNAH